MKNYLSVKNLSYSYPDGHLALKKISFDLAEKESLAILGPNGAGKTTCFYMMVGLIKSDSGSVLLDDKNISNKPMFERAKLGIGYLAQEASVFRKLSVEDNIKAVLQIGNLPKIEQNKKLSLIHI